MILSSRQTTKALRLCCLQTPEDRLTQVAAQLCLKTILWQYLATKNLNCLSQKLPDYYTCAIVFINYTPTKCSNAQHLVEY